MISIDEFAQVELRVGTIIKAKVMEEADKLLVLSVDMGEEKLRTIVSGIRVSFPDPGVLEGTQCAFVANLAPRIIKGITSQGMILATHNEEGEVVLVRPSSAVPAGTRLG